MLRPLVDAVIPGITVDYKGTTLACEHTEHTGIESFAGGVSDGILGVAVMRYTNPFTNALKWQKAWFFLDNDVQQVMVSDIKATTNNSVYTVLDQKRHNGAILVDGFDVRDCADLQGVQTLWHDSIGYVFGTEDNPNLRLSVKAGPRSGDWGSIGISEAGISTVDLFAAWIDHGPAGARMTSASYTIFPAVDLSMFQHKRASTKLRTLRNDASVSALYDDTHRVLMAVFWDEDGGSIQFSISPSDAPMTVSTNANLVIIYRRDEQTITVADPSQTLTSVEVSFLAGSRGRRPAFLASALSKEVVIALPNGGSAGSSVTQVLTAE